MRYWDNKEVEGRGTRFCLVIDPEDGTGPMRTYGWNEREVLDKMARTTEEAQKVIARQRAEAASRPKTAAAAAATPQAPAGMTPDERMKAVADLSNPATAGSAIKKLLVDDGVNLDEGQGRDAKHAATVAAAWRLNHPEFPMDPRNQELLMMKAVILANGRLAKVTSQILDSAWQEIVDSGLVYEKPSLAPADESPDSRANEPPRRTATSYRRTALRGETPSQAPRPKYTREDIDKMNSRTLRDKIEHELGFKELVNQLSTPAAVNA